MIFKRLFCNHEWTFHGWSYVKCIKCGKVKDDEELNEKLQKDFLEKRIIKDCAVFGRDAINKQLAKRGRSL